MRILCNIIAILIVILGTAFINWTFDFSALSISTRIMVVVFIVIALFIVNFLYDTNK